MEVKTWSTLCLAIGFESWLGLDTVISIQDHECIQLAFEEEKEGWKPVYMLSLSLPVKSLCYNGQN